MGSSEPKCIFYKLSVVIKMSVTIIILLSNSRLGVLHFFLLTQISCKSCQCFPEVSFLDVGEIEAKLAS